MEMDENTLQEQSSFMSLLEKLFRHGLCELPVLYSRVNGSYLGYMVYEKGQLSFRDSGLFSCEDAELLDWQHHTIGMVCYREMLQWKSLSFYGIDFCNLAAEIDANLKASLGRIQNEYGDHGHDFVGSVYRAYRLLLANEFLPVVVLQQTVSDNNHFGLLIADLRAADLPSEVQQEVHKLIQQTLDIRLTLGLSDQAA